MTGLNTMKSIIRRRPFWALLAATVLLGACAIEVKEEDFFVPTERQPARVDETGAADFEIEPRYTDYWQENGVTFQYRVHKTPMGSIALRLARQSDAQKPLIVFCGGNAFDLYRNAEQATYRAVAHGDVLVWDYPGYGYSEGEASVDDIDQAVTALADDIADFQRSEEQDVIFWGFSLGTAICSQFAVKTAEADGLILEAPFNSATDAARSYVPWIARPVVRLNIDPAVTDYDLAELLRGFEAPVMIMAAGKDKVLRPYLARDLRDTLEGQGKAITYVEFEKAGHFTLSDESGFQPAIAGFIEKAVTGREP